MDVSVVDGVQDLVDQLAECIRQSVAVDDPSGNLMLDSDGFAFDTIGAVLTSDRGINAADVVHVHRTTLHYRLQQIAETAGLDLAVPADRSLTFGIWLRVALMRSPIASLVASNCAHS